MSEHQVFKVNKAPSDCIERATYLLGDKENARLDLLELPLNTGAKVVACRRRLRVLDTQVKRRV